MRTPDNSNLWPEWFDSATPVSAPNKLAAAVTKVVHTPPANAPARAVEKQSSEITKAVILQRGSDVTPEAVRWLWNGWLAAGKLHLIGGQPGTGKTTIAGALAAVITTGGKWPDGSQAKHGSVAIWSGEDSAADTLAPRLLAAGADMDRVHFVDGVRENGQRYPFDPATDTDALAEALADIDDLALLVVDPIVSAVSGDSHKNAEVRRGLQPLVDLAERCGCAVLGVTHFTKGTAGRNPVERITGSLAFAALARVVLVTAKQEATDGEARSVLLRAKSNIGPDDGGFVYDLRQGELSDHPGVTASSVHWGEALTGSARELLAEAEAQPDGDMGQDAAGFLRDLLARGSRPAKEIFADANGAGFSQQQMHRAKRKAGAVAVKRGGNFGGGKQEWVWSLPAEGIDRTAEDAEGIEQFCATSSTPSGEQADGSTPSLTPPNPNRPRLSGLVTMPKRESEP